MLIDITFDVRTNAGGRDPDIRPEAASVSRERPPLLPFADFTPTARPADVASYMALRQASIAFVRARNERIHQWTSEHLATSSTPVQPSPAVPINTHPGSIPLVSASQWRRRQTCRQSRR